ncbi:MAG TPA: hypothetical protein VGW74_18250, partial [Propionibacteriaceae bacterium]|nr:hypothetical protein [Propionibacteriaceae bacterium]
APRSPARGGQLLPRHRDPEPLVGVDEMVGVLCVLAEAIRTQLTITAMEALSRGGGRLTPGSWAAGTRSVGTSSRSWESEQPQR